MDTIEVMRKALEALENSVDLVQAEFATDWRHGMPTRVAQLNSLRRMAEDHASAIASLRAEIERLEAVEPYTWYDDSTGETYTADAISDGVRFAEELRPLYAAPVAPVIPALTDDEMEQAYRALWREKPSDFDFTTHSWIELGARWAYALAAERAGVQIKEEK